MAVAVLLAVVLWPGGRMHGVVDNARAALGQGPILHLVYREPSRLQLVELHGKRTIDPAYETESWTDRKLAHVHLITRLNGQAVSETVLPDDLDGGRVDPARAALWTAYRSALEHGTAKVERQGRLFGRPVYWLRLPPARPDPLGSLVAIDGRTFRPLAFRYGAAPGRYLNVRVLLARLEASSAADFRHRTNVNSFGGVSSSSGSSSSPVALPRPAKPWLTAGPSVAGLRQRAVGRFSDGIGGRSARGFAVDYGLETSPRSVRIEQVKPPVDRSAWRGIPRGFVGITKGQVTSSDERTWPLWTGNLVVDGVYVTIQTGFSVRALLAAARALRPV